MYEHFVTFFQRSQQPW